MSVSTQYVCAYLRYVSVHKHTCVAVLHIHYRHTCGHMQAMRRCVLVGAHVVFVNAHMVHVCVCSMCGRHDCTKVVPT